jgi:hypothetical protein
MTALTPLEVLTAFFESDHSLMLGDEAAASLLLQCVKDAGYTIVETEHYQALHTYAMRMRDAGFPPNTLPARRNPLREGGE